MDAMELQEREKEKLIRKENDRMPVQETGNQQQGQGDNAQGQGQGHPVAGGSGIERPVGGDSPPNPRGDPGIQGAQACKFKKKICVKFLPLRKSLNECEEIEHQNPDYSRENIRCKCGLKYKEHDPDKVREGLYELVADLLEKKVSINEFISEVYVEDGGERLQHGYKWKTRYEDPMLEVDGAEMGKLEFQMGHSRTLSSKFTRLSDKTDMDVLKSFLKSDWKLLEAEPELIISLVGTTTNKALVDKLVEGILKISKFVNVIILTSGLESDIVAKKIGDAIMREQRWTTEGDTQSKAKIKCVGIASWGSLKRKPEKVNNGLFTIRANVNSPIQSFVFNPGHSYLLLVDNGTTDGLPYDLNKFWVELENRMKSDTLRVMNLILGNKTHEKHNLDMIDLLLQYGFPVIFMQHSDKYLDILIDGVLYFQREEMLDKSSLEAQVASLTKDAQMKVKLIDFLDRQLVQDAAGQRKNVITVCNLLNEAGDDSEVGHNLDSVMLQTFTKPSIVKAQVNNREPDHEYVLQILKLAIKWQCWDVSMDQLLTYEYKWTDDEKMNLYEILKDCLQQDQPDYISVLNRDNWAPVETFLSIGMLAELYQNPQQLMNDPLKAVLTREKIRGDEKSLQLLIYNLSLPDCYLSEFKQGNEGLLSANPYKDLLIWAVLSKKWKIVQYILHNQKEDILAWFLATAYLCKAIALCQLDLEVRKEYKVKQHYYEEKGMELLQDLSMKHGNTNCHHLVDGSVITYPHLSLEMPSSKWGNLCPADLALLGNFKTFVRSETFHNYLIKRWKKKTKGPECCCSCPPSVRFYTHWVFYMIMVFVFCAAIIVRVPYTYQIGLVLWIFCYQLGEIITRRQQQMNVKFCSKRKQLLLFSRKYLHHLLLFLFLIGGFVCNIIGHAHWGGMCYGIACLILILCIGGHFMQAFRIFAPQISILKKAMQEVGTFMILIILLIWSVTMVFHAVLCLDSTTEAANQTTSDEVASGGWANTIHAAFFLYLSLYGEYSFELNESGHLACVADKRALVFVSYVLIGLHILIGNVLLMNLLVSVIGTKTENLQSDLVYVWKSNWYKLTLHYEKQTTLPPPFNIFELLVRLVCFCKGKCTGQDQVDAPMHHSDTTANLQLYQQEAMQALSDGPREKGTRI